MDQQADPLRIELGAWTTSRPGWICTDVRWRGTNYLDGTQPWPLASGSASYVYADNVIEHISVAANRVLIREAFRVLQPGGRIRLVTPDVESLARLYRGDAESAAPPLAEVREEGYSVFHQVDVLRFAFQDDGHPRGYLWDFDSLSAELQRAGFSDVTRHETGQSEDPNLCLMELRVGTPVADIFLSLRGESQPIRRPCTMRCREGCANGSKAKPGPWPGPPALRSGRAWVLQDATHEVSGDRQGTGPGRGHGIQNVG